MCKLDASKPRCIDSYCLMADLRGIRGNVLRHRAVPSCGRQSNREARKSDGNTVRQLCKLTDDPNVELKRIQTHPGIKKLLVHERQSEMKRLAGRTERLSRFRRDRE